MKKKNLGLMILVAGLLLSGIKAYAADGDLIVNGHLQVTGQVQVYRLPHVCAGLDGILLTTSPTCYTLQCAGGDDLMYFTCSGVCVSYGGPAECSTVYVGKLFP